MKDRITGISKKGRSKKGHMIKKDRVNPFKEGEEKKSPVLEIKRERRFLSNVLDWIETDLKKPLKKRRKKDDIMSLWEIIVEEESWLKSQGVSLSEQETERIEFLKKKLKPEKYKSSLVFERQKFPTKKYPNTTVRNMRLNLSELRVLHAIQILLDETNYEGNRPPKKLSEDNPFHFHSPLPVIGFSLPDFFKAFGLEKKKNKSGKMQYNWGECKLALNALFNLRRPAKFFYWKEFFVEGKKGKKEARYDVIKTEKPILEIIEGWKDLNKRQFDRVMAEKDESRRITKIVIMPSPPIVEGVRNYFNQRRKTYTLKRKSLDRDIKKLSGSRKSKYVTLFIDYLHIQEDRENKIKVGTLAEKLRMNPFIQERQWKRISDTLKECFTVATKLELVSALRADFYSPSPFTHSIV